MMAAATGLRQRHGNRCARKGRCSCPWEAFVYSKRDGKKIRKSFPTRAAAVSWRRDSASAVEKRLMRAPTSITLGEAGDQWLEQARTGLVRTRSGAAYKPAAVRAYEAAWRLRVRPELGSRRLSDVDRTDLQDLVDQLVADGLNSSTIVVTLLPVRGIYKRAVSRGEVAVNPTQGLAMPAVRGGRDRIASPAEGLRLLEAVPKRDRPVWATAMYAGLRRGELMALRVEDIDLPAGVIRVCRGWDAIEGPITPKSGKDRKVPIAGALRAYLAEHLLGLGRREGLVFGSAPSTPFAGRLLTDRADTAWKAAGLERITLHECRHTFASLMIAAGVNAKALSEYMGHAKISTTMDLYGHLMPGNESEAAAMLDAYLGAQVRAAAC
jgi:integrase